MYYGMHTGRVFLLYDRLRFLTTRQPGFELTVDEQRITIKWFHIRRLYCTTASFSYQRKHNHPRKLQIEIFQSERISNVSSQNNDKCGRSTQRCNASTFSWKYMQITAQPASTTCLLAFCVGHYIIFLDM